MVVSSGTQSRCNPASWRSVVVSYNVSSITESLQPNQSYIKCPRNIAINEWTAPCIVDISSLCFPDALTGDVQLRCLLRLSPCPGNAAREHLISETTAILINGLSTR